MSEVTVKANQPALGLPDGAIVTVERTERVDGAINAGILTVVGDAERVEPIDEPAIDEPPQDSDPTTDQPDAGHVETPAPSRKSRRT